MKKLDDIEDLSLLELELHLDRSNIWKHVYFEYFLNWVSFVLQMWRQMSAWIIMGVAGKIKQPASQPARYEFKHIR